MTEEECPECLPGAPMWIVTFADLMSLLMSFFVLLLAFSEMDVLKFKQVAGSMAQAFGVQKVINSDGIPKGTSIIAQEFSPGKPVPTVLQVIQQMTTNDSKQNLDFTDSETRNDGGKKPKESEIADAQQAKKMEMLEAKQSEMLEAAGKLQSELMREIAQGMLEIEIMQDQIVVRIREKGSFASGRADIQRSFIPILNKISRTVNEMDGQVVVAGHTDDIPIATAQYPSNWVLSASRAARVVHYMIKFGKVDESRLQMRAHADTLPIVENDSRENRAKNRRVEIILATTKETVIFSIDDDNIEVLNPESELSPPVSEDALQPAPGADSPPVIEPATVPGS